MGVAATLSAEQFASPRALCYPVFESLNRIEYQAENARWIERALNWVQILNKFLSRSIKTHLRLRFMSIGR